MFCNQINQTQESMEEQGASQNVFGIVFICAVHDTNTRLFKRGTFQKRNKHNLQYGKIYVETLL